MIFESKEFKNVSEYDQVYKDFKDKIKTGLNVSFNFNLTQSLYTMYGYNGSNWIGIINGTIHDQKRAVDVYNSYESFKLISENLKVKKRK